MSLKEYTKALESLNLALQEKESDIVRDATIQRFEFCIELSWKCSKKILGTTSHSPKNVIREMAQENLIDDVKIWLKAIDFRNLSVHTYNEDIAIEVYNFIKEFFINFKKLKNKLELY